MWLQLLEFLSHYSRDYTPHQRLYTPMASQITSLTIVYSSVYSGADQRKHQSSVSLAFVRGIQRSLVNFPHKRPVMRKMFLFDDVIMYERYPAVTVLNFILLLTHLPLDKMAAILADNIFNCIFLNENYRIPIHISLKYVPSSPINNKPALFQVMVWRRTGDKPLPGAMMTHFIDTYMHH